ncbi:hypothetical protein HYPSUDRAFT_44772 [Hypholoma sublateritium FD-334 SS-4]|uniref:SAC3/GANP/THP3 conserved domain-containing protein n=1 Tax=Hypholoma sublateritium (strain FD-334 SS-4) TaxID=945553 RepID=A0A0D2KW80_HYPSF|nr:hypothetical protein HYPSUDRAFT_44772 [Hypholoma sublateritium FD-334 SS-4]
MDASSYPRGSRGRGNLSHDAARGRPHSRNKHWSAADSVARTNTPNHSDGERWERGGHRGSGRGRGVPRGVAPIFHNVSLRLNHSPFHSPQPQRTPVVQQPVHPPEVHEDVEIEGTHDEEDELYEEGDDIEPRAETNSGSFAEIHEPELDSPEEREKFYQELVKAREQERKIAIAEGKMDDPLVPKRLEDAISIVGTCMDMCPRFERYRRERENNLFEWETIPGTKRVNHNRAVKMYERAAGDKTLPSDLRPPLVLKRTLDYLFRDLLPRGGFSAAFNFIRDRSRAVRNDFTMQHITGPLAIECHDRCARFHILALHFERDTTGFSIPLEEQQLMNTLQSLKEFYEDQRGRYESPTELEMRVYHRLIHIRDQKERHEDIPDYITSHPVFKLTTAFRLHVQEKSAPISKTSRLVVNAEGMQIFGQLATVLKEQGSTVMVYLVACLLERLFGKDTIEDIEAIKGDLSIPDIIDGVSSRRHIQQVHQDYEQETEEIAEGDEDELEEYYDNGDEEDYEEGGYTAPVLAPAPQPTVSVPFKPSSTEWPSNAPAPPPSIPQPAPAPTSAFAGLVSKPNPFGVQSIFGTSPFAPSSTSSTPILQGTPSPFGNFGSPAIPPTASSLPPTNVRSPPQQAAPADSPFAFAAANSSSATFASNAPPTNSFNIPPKFVSMPTASTSQPSQSSAPTSVFGGANGSFFSTPFSISASGSTPPFGSVGTTNVITPPLNPKASEFAPAANPSVFSQPPTFPSANGMPKFSSPNPTYSQTIATTNLQPTAAFNIEPTANGASVFNTNASTSTPSYFQKPSPPGSKSVTPPLNRLTAPPLLKIDTNTSTGSSTSSAASPRVPPPMPKKQPISLPSTPTTVLQPPSALLGYLRSTLEGASSSSSSLGSPTSSQDMLSPLVMGSPTMSDAKPFNNFTPLSTPKALRRFSGTAPALPSPSEKGKDSVHTMYDADDTEVQKERALAFARRSVLVRSAFERWVQRATDRAAYLEARRHDEEYRAKLHRARADGRAGALELARAGNGMSVDKKRRVSTNGTAGDEHHHGQAPMKKRAARKRVSGDYRAPRTDEELARRFKENHEEQELRWAKGSFLQMIRRAVGKLNAATLKLPWNIWLSMNPESDGTAIWLERKFDVPASGAWVSEAVFSIPLATGGPDTAGYPGLIVFEATPLGDVSDELEKKYRILDDCSRLREIIKSLSPRRHFIPSLLVICWDVQDQDSTPSDFLVMVKKLVADSVLHSYQMFAITACSKDMDHKLDGILNTLALDTEGKLVRTLSLAGVFKLYEPIFEAFLTEWLENCTVNGRFDWNLYAQLVQVSVVLLNFISTAVQSLLELSGPRDPLPSFEYHYIGDSESCYGTVNEWLSTLSSQDDSKMIATDLHSHRNIGQDFPGRVFIGHLLELTKTRFERLYPRSANTERAVLTSSIDASLEAFNGAIRPLQLKLSQAYNFSARRSPKRRAYSVATSEHGSPEAKRARFSASVASASTDGEVDGLSTVPTTPQMNGNRQMQTPSPTGSTVSAAATDRTEQERPAVTVAMLRALTRDLKKKYAVGCS